MRRMAEAMILEAITADQDMTSQNRKRDYIIHEMDIMEREQKIRSLKLELEERKLQAELAGLKQ